MRHLQFHSLALQLQQVASALANPLKPFSFLAGLTFYAACMAVVSAAELTEFQRFVAKPPVIEELRFTATDMTALQQTGVEQIKRYFGRWQPDSMMLRQLVGEQLPDDPNVIAPALYSRIKDRYVYYSPKKVFVGWTDNGREPLDRKSPIWNMNICDGEATLAKALNFGVFAAGIGTIRWNGLRFTAPDYCTYSKCEGELENDGEGRPKLIRFSIFSGGGTGNWLAEYAFETARSNAFLPSEINLFRVFPSNRVHAVRYSFQKLATASAPLPPDKFSIEKIVQHNQAVKGGPRSVEWTNRQMGVIGHRGVFTPLTVPAKPPTNTKVFPYLFWPAVFIFLTLGFLLLQRERGKRR